MAASGVDGVLCPFCSIFHRMSLSDLASLSKVMELPDGSVEYGQPCSNNFNHINVIKEQNEIKNKNPHIYVIIIILCWWKIPKIIFNFKGYLFCQLTFFNIVTKLDRLS